MPADIEISKAASLVLYQKAKYRGFSVLDAQGQIILDCGIHRLRDWARDWADQELDAAIATRQGQREGGQP